MGFGNNNNLKWSEFIEIFHLKLLVPTIWSLNVTSVFHPFFFKSSQIRMHTAFLNQFGELISKDSLISLIFPIY